MKKLLSILLIAFLLESCSDRVSPDEAEALAQECFLRGDSLHYKARNFPDALRSLFEADTYARLCHNDTLKACIANAIGNVFFDSYKPADARRYYEKALDDLKDSGDEKWLLRARYGVACTRHALNEHDEAIGMLIEIADSARLAGYPEVRSAALSFLGNSYMHIDRFDDAIATFHTMADEAGMGATDSCMLLYSLARAHRFEEFRRLDSTFTLPPTNLQLAAAREAYYEEIGDAAHLYEQAEIVTNAIADKFYESYDDGILGTIEAHFLAREELKSEQLESQRTLTWVITIAALIIIILVGVGLLLYHRYRMRLKDAELQLTLTQLRDMTQADTDKQLRNRQLVAEMFKNQWATLNMLCNEYFEKGDTPLRKTILVEMEREIRRIAEPAGVRHIAEALDSHFDNIITRLREQIPDLSDKDLAFLIFSYAGFSPRAICLFNGYTLKYYYKKRAVMKERLADSGAPDAAVFVDFLG